jgi:hypothetical protein
MKMSSPAKSCKTQEGRSYRNPMALSTLLL